MSIMSAIRDLFAPRPARHEYGFGGIVNHPSIYYKPSDERWFAYLQDGCGAGGPLISVSGEPAAGAVYSDNWQEWISQEIVSEGWLWERGSEWTAIHQVTGLEWHRPLAVDEYGNP